MPFSTFSGPHPFLIGTRLPQLSHYATEQHDKKIEQDALLDSVDSVDFAGFAGSIVKAL